MTALSDRERSPRQLRRALILQGAVTLGLGAVLIAAPGHSLTLVAIVAGMALCATGLFELARAAHPGLPRAQRVGIVVTGLLALAAGGLAIARPQGTIRAVATVVAGIVLLAWPDITPGAFAVVAGVFLVLAGALELWAGLTRHPDRVVTE